jgi:hypothetical protein
MDNLPPIQKPRVTLKDATDVKCASCGCIYFTNVIAFKKLSGILTGKPKPSLIPIEAFRCSDCGSVLEELLPNLDNEIKE